MDGLMSTFADPPRQVAWRHKDLREGFEVVFIEPRWTVEGATTAVEDGAAFAVQYAIDLTPDWVTRGARVASFGREVQLLADGDGRWLVDGVAVPSLDGVFDVDLESSSFTNAFPVHRLALAVGETADAPAAWVRRDTLAVERLEQRYTRLPDDADGRSRFDYWSPDLSCELLYDEFGLVLDYPGIAERAAV
ncbi:putative glycolipid-binding domain-containing protein [Solirubrobacter phytolaccae]|uniref:Glycolipid-binding domain-containing protein n=1 Tax=Solirubrobacter phytolaccae TaxID=1404360 RepID=A0A9X3N947_9ACTN|nr:putative glycolipid-binding domain-containing protein [Solirubrobacter phytolaccae]MDA0182078.1 putative glycolipid-binding domain-containing protein [Solirubrobacter phytolaccae]